MSSQEAPVGQQDHQEAQDQNALYLGLDAQHQQVSQMGAVLPQENRENSHHIHQQNGKNDQGSIQEIPTDQQVPEEDQDGFP